MLKTHLPCRLKRIMTRCDGVAFLPFFPLLQVWCPQFSWRGESPETHAVDVRQLLRGSRQVLGYSPLPWEWALDGGMLARKARVCDFSRDPAAASAADAAAQARGARQTQAIQWRIKGTSSNYRKWKQSVHCCKTYFVILTIRDIFATALQ